jgi:hypothetical protein
MKRNKKWRLFGFIWLSIIAFIVFTVFYGREQRTKANYKIQFAGIIYKIKKSARQYDDVFVTNGKNCLLLHDLIKRDRGYVIAIGDSLIKTGNSSCFVYKRVNTIIFQACDLGYSMYFSEKKPQCP